MIALTNLIDLAWAAVLVPVWALDSGGGAAAVGACSRRSRARPRSAHWCAAAYGDRLPRYATYLFCFLVTGLPRFVVMAVDTPLWVVLAFCVVGRLRLWLPQPDPRRGDLRAGARPRSIGRVTSLSTACASH